MIPKLYSAGNAARLYAVKTDRFKTGLFSFLAAMPIDRESACLAPLLLSVLRRGTVEYPTVADISRRLDWLWGTGFSVRSSYRGNLLIVGFSANLLDGAFLPQGGDELMCGVQELMRQILLCPVTEADGMLSRRYIESEKQLQCDAILAQRNNPRAYAADRCRSILYKQEPCGIPLWGSVEETGAVTCEALTAYRERFLQAFRPLAFFVGSAAPQSLSAQLAARFGESFSFAEQLPTCGHRLVRRTEPLRVEETLEVAQSQLVLGLRTGVLLGDADFFACAVYNEILGMSPISRLFVYVREKKSLCYSCSSSYNGMLGSILISCGLKAENRAAAEEEILCQLEQMRTGGFTDAELDAAKSSLINAYCQLQDSAGGLESYWLGRMLMGEAATLSIEESVCRLRSVTREEVLRVARQVTVEVTYFLKGTLEGEDADDADDEI